MEKLTNIATSVAEILKQNKQTVAVSESSGGGLISAALLSIPGASAYFIGGAVVYTRTAQKELLNVPDDTMLDIRASTEEYALLNARTVSKLLGATWGISETGASGPTGNRYGDAPGHTCIAVSGPVERSITLETGETNREDNMWKFADAALKLLYQCVEEAN